MKAIVRVVALVILSASFLYAQHALNCDAGCGDGSPTGGSGDGKAMLVSTSCLVLESNLQGNCSAMAQQGMPVRPSFRRTLPKAEHREFFQALLSPLPALDLASQSKFLISAFAQTPAPPQTTPAETGPRIAISDSQAISVEFVGPQDATQALGSGQAQPLSLARGDFDEDGIEDLVAGYSAPGGKGVVVLYRGNLDAFAPQSEGSWLAIGRGQFPPTFLSIAATFLVPTAADLLATGNFLGSDHLDVVTAARGDNTLYLLTGNGTGNFVSVEPIQLPGPVSAMAAGRFGASNSRSTVIVGIGGSKPAVLVYSGSSQGLSPAGQFALTAPATSFAFDDLDGDGRPDVGMVTGQHISILHASGAAGKPELETLSLAISAVAVTTGFFVHDRGWRRQIAVLDTAGAVHVVAHGGIDSRGWTKAEVALMRNALRNRRSNPFARTEAGPAKDGWKVVETLSAVTSPRTSGGLMVPSRIFGQGTDDVLVLDSDSGKIAVASHPRVTSKAGSFLPASLSTRVYSGGAPVAVLSFPVNVDAREGLVVLHRGQTMPAVMMPVSGRSLTSQAAQGAK